MKVAVLGLGYVGTVTAAVLASNGHDVVGADVDRTKARLVAEGKSTVIEPGLDDLVGRGVAAGCLRGTTDVHEALDGAELSLVCVGTPSSPNGGTDLAHVRRAVADVADAFAGGAQSPTGRHAVVVRSTVPPGTIDGVVEPLLQERAGRSSTRLAPGMCPEFLREGSAITDFHDAPLMVIGTSDPHVASTVQRLFAFLSVPVRVVPTRDAEGLKYACNAFHATKVSFANELGRLFRLLGVDARRVMELFCDDPKLNLSSTYLSPGFAFGGSCLPKDLRSLLHLARTHFVDLPLLSGAMATNVLCVSEAVSRVLATDARSVALLGLSFKMESDDLRESPYVDLAEALIGKGVDVRIYDPVVDPARLVGANRHYLAFRLPHVQRTLRASPEEALRGVDLALVSRSNAAVVDALVRFPPPKVIDLNGHLGPVVEGLPQYEGVAW